MNVWMAVSGATGFGLFCLIHFTQVFAGGEVVPAVFQIAANAFVFVTWGRGFLVAQKMMWRIISFIGTVVPVGMATATVVRVFL